MAFQRKKSHSFDSQKTGQDHAGSVVVVRLIGRIRYGIVYPVNSRQEMTTAFQEQKGQGIYWSLELKSHIHATFRNTGTFRIQFQGAD